MTDKELFGSVLKGMGSLGARLFPFIFVFNSMLIVAGWSDRDDPAAGMRACAQVMVVMSLISVGLFVVGVVVKNDTVKVEKPKRKRRT